MTDINWHLRSLAGSYSSHRWAHLRHALAETNEVAFRFGPADSAAALCTLGPWMYPRQRYLRHERFAQALAEGQSATEAYEVAGYTPNDGNAARMKGNDRVKERIAELQGQGAKRAVVTLESLIAEACDIQAKALGEGKFSAAVSALTVKAKLAGFLTDHPQNKPNVVYHISSLSMTKEEWIAKYCRDEKPL